MGGRENAPLTVEEAKDRLREAMGDLGLAACVRRHPIGTLVAGVLAGLSFGSLSRETRDSLASQMIRFLLRG